MLKKQTSISAVQEEQKNTIILKTVGGYQPVNTE